MCRAYKSDGTIIRNGVEWYRYLMKCDMWNIAHYGYGNIHQEFPIEYPFIVVTSNKDQRCYHHYIYKDKCNELLGSNVEIESHLSLIPWRGCYRLNLYNWFMVYSDDEIAAIQKSYYDNFDAPIIGNKQLDYLEYITNNPNSIYDKNFGFKKETCVKCQ